MNIVQIGCFDGNDDVYTFVKQHKSLINRLVLVEPLLPKLKEAQERYSEFENVEFFNIAITPYETVKRLTLYYPKELQHAQLTSVNKDNVKKFFNDTEISEFEISATTLNNFLEQNNLWSIDRLYIDTEGLDCKIILNLKLDKFNISYIEYEYVHCDGVDTYGSTGISTESLLLSLGYKKSMKPPFNMVFQK